MSIISHLLYDEQQSATYQKEAESIVSSLSGFSFQEAEERGCGNIYRIAVTEALRWLTLYDLSHPVAPARTASSERCDQARRGADSILRKYGWQTA